MSDDFLGSVGPLEAEQHGVGHIAPAGRQVLQQHLQPPSVPADVQRSVSARDLGSFSLRTSFLGLDWDVLGAQLAFLHRLLRGGLLLRRLRLRLATLGVDVEDGGSPYGASAEHAEICGPPVGGRLSLRRNDRGPQLDYRQWVRKGFRASSVFRSVSQCSHWLKSVHLMVSSLVHTEPKNTDW